ncbi:MAG TPA: NADH-quinone oxidoreductase subunit NuoN [Micromonosporaceae bacterium]|jgi:NADH-quinone oxidoreductase subunit N
MRADVMAIDITIPALDYLALAPLLIIFGAACLGILVEAFAARRSRPFLQFWLALIALAASLVVLVRAANNAPRTFTADVAIAVDGPTLFLQGTIIVLGMVTLLLLGERRIERGGPFVARAAIPVGGELDRRQARESGATEVFPLTLFALGGMMLFVAANDLLTMFVALEVFSLPLYVLCSLARRRRLISQEAALKYFLLGAFAAAFFIFGMALLYGFAGTVSLGGIHAAALGSQASPLLLFAGIALLAVALLFKVAAVPFHVWTPDVYQGAPTPITALMAACTKTAAFGALLRVLYVALDRVRWDIEPVLGTVAILTMLIGAVLAVTQTDIKRLLAYSSIANAGYLLVGVLAFSRDGLSSSLFYLAAYGFTVIAAFAVVSLVRDDDGEATHLSRWAGLGKRSPVVAGLFTFLLLAFAGIPLTSGFTSKFAVFGAAFGANSAWQTATVIAGIVTSMVLAFPYLRVVVMMWLSEPAENAPSVSGAGTLTWTAVWAGAIATFVLGVYPSPVLDLAQNAAQFLQ